MPATSAIVAAANDSSSVAGNRSLISDETVRPWRRLRPKSRLHDIADEVAELDIEGLVEPEIGAQARPVFGSGILAEHLVHRVADVLEQQEGDEGHRQHHEDGLQQTGGQ